MSYSVTSWFVDQAKSKMSSPIRKFTIGNSDYSDRVLSWPSFGVEWNNIKPVRLTMNMANEDGAMNFLRTNKVNMQNSCSLDIGFTHATSGDETINVFKGKIDSIQFTDGTIRTMLADKFKIFEERLIGTSNSVEDYTSSNYLVSDLAWWICTSYGGLSGVQSTNNPDINFESFDTWAGVMSGDVVLVQGRFAGVKVLEALRKVARITKTAIYQEEDKIHFQRFSLTHSYNTNLTNNEILGLSLTIDSKKLINKKYVMFDYDTTSRYHKQTVIDADSASINSYGLNEHTEKDASMWYVNSQSAINFAQREILIEKVPYDQVVVNAPLVAMLRTVGESISVTDPLLGVGAESFRIMKRQLNMEQGTVNLNADASQLFGGFTLDTSSLNGDDVLT